MTKQNTERATITNIFDSDQCIYCYLYCFVERCMKGINEKQNGNCINEGLK